MIRPIILTQKVYCFDIIDIGEYFWMHEWIFFLPLTQSYRLVSTAILNYLNSILKSFHLVSVYSISTLFGLFYLVAPILYNYAERGNLHNFYKLPVEGNYYCLVTKMLICGSGNAYTITLFGLLIYLVAPILHNYAER